jgi:hypothetical protein
MSIYLNFHSESSRPAGTVIAESGYGFAGGMPGHLLPVFGAD